MLRAYEREELWVEAETGIEERRFQGVRRRGMGSVHDEV